MQVGIAWCQYAFWAHVRDRWEFPSCYKAHWQSPCTALPAGKWWNSLSSRGHQVQSNCQWRPKIREGLFRSFTRMQFRWWQRRNQSLHCVCKLLILKLQPSVPVGSELTCLCSFSASVLKQRRLMSSSQTAHQSLPVDYPDNKVHGANMGPIWGRQDPGGPMLAPWTSLSVYLRGGNVNLFYENSCISDKQPLPGVTTQINCIWLIAVNNWWARWIFIANN